MLRRILHELKHHAPFTLAGTLVGVVVMLVMVFSRASHEVSHTLFAVFHPAHVLLSALTTAAMFRVHGRGKWWTTIIVGIVGAIGIATLSDSIIPFVGEKLLSLPHAHVHAGFIEQWFIVLPAALAGALLAFVWPRTEIPHAGHVLLSTSASLFHMTMALGGQVGPGTMAALTAFLFLAVWLPCCTSDIIFPLLFVKKNDRQSALESGTFPPAGLKSQI